MVRYHLTLIEIGLFLFSCCILMCRRVFRITGRTKVSGCYRVGIFFFFCGKQTKLEGKIQKNRTPFGDWMSGRFMVFRLMQYLLLFVLAQINSAPRLRKIHLGQYAKYYRISLFPVENIHTNREICVISQIIDIR